MPPSILATLGKGVIITMLGEEMKRLRKIALNLDRSAWPNEYGYAFYLRSRSLCNYIERSLSRIDVRSVNASKLCITGRLREDVSFVVNSSNVACLSVPFSPLDYDSLQTDEDINAFMVHFMRSGLALIPPGAAGDVEPILEIIQQFAAGGYLNEWQHKSRVFRESGLRVSLDCSLTCTCFELHMNATNSDGNIFRRKILRTDPDEIAFHRRFKDILLEADYLVISSKLDEPLCRIPLAELNHQTRTTEYVVGGNGG